jgi:putative protein kinase ArgK-like GTPase of G3E family
MDELIRLLEGSWGDEAGLAVIGLHGLGGMGKSTLANLLCSRHMEARSVLDPAGEISDSSRSRRRVAAVVELDLWFRPLRESHVQPKLREALLQLDCPIDERDTMDTVRTGCGHWR